MKKYDTIKALLRQDNYNSFLDNLVRGKEIDVAVK